MIFFSLFRFWGGETTLSNLGYANLNLQMQLLQVKAGFETGLERIRIKRSENPEKNFSGNITKKGRLDGYLKYVNLIMQIKLYKQLMVWIFIL